MTVTELIQEEITSLTEYSAKEVLDFILFLKMKNEKKEWEELQKAQQSSLTNIWDNEEDKVWDNV